MSLSIRRVIRAFNLRSLLVILSLLFIGVVIYISLQYSQKEAINLLVPVIASFSLVITTLIAWQFNNYQMKQSTQQIIITHFQSFRKKKFFNNRMVAWRVKEKWYNKDLKDYQASFINALICEEEVECETYKITRREIYSVYELLAFFAMLSTYKDSAKILRTLNNFYYAWWRKFLLEVAELYENKRFSHINQNILQDRIPGFKKKYFLRSIGFTEKLKELDRICGFDSLPLDKDGTPFSIYIENS